MSKEDELTAEEIMKLLPMKKKYENGGFKVEDKESEKEVKDEPKG